MNCVICGAEFTPRVSWQKTCGSAECKKELTRRNNSNTIDKYWADRNLPRPDLTIPRTCVICGRQYMPRSGQQKTCGYQECKNKYQSIIKRNLYNANKDIYKENREDRILDQLPDPVPAGELHLTMENICLLAEAVFDNAWQEKDWDWFKSKNAQLYYDTVGVSREAVLAKVNQVRYYQS